MQRIGLFLNRTVVPPAILIFFVILFNMETVDYIIALASIIDKIKFDYAVTFYRDNKITLCVTNTY